jgi:lipid A oxidase
MGLTMETLKAFCVSAFRLALVAAGGFALIGMSNPAQAEMQLSTYIGANWSPHSVVDYDFNNGDGRQSETVGWDGEQLEWPSYFGFRATWWFDSHPNWGIAFDNNHAKVAASPMPDKFTKLEFTDGINIYTANIFYRHLNETNWTPYIGVGAGFTTPRIEVTAKDGSTKTDEYQFGGPAFEGVVGVSYQFNEKWSAFGEYKMAYAMIHGDLNGGGFVETNIVSNQLAVGVSYKLDSLLGYKF